MTASSFSALYVHVPFCAAKCGYCAFYSVPDATADARRAYLRRLDEELAAQAPRCAPLASVYVGGGTPSVLGEDELDALLRTVRARVTLADGAEFTVECNPDSLTAAKVAIPARHGVNRVSLGVQSFEPRLRGVIGRRGSIERLPDVLGWLADVGIANVGMDLIYAIPGQTLDDWRADVQRACGCGISHLSAYELTAEEGARLAGIERTDDDLAVAMWRAAAEVAAGHGIARYEVSNLAQPGSECRHNDAVWHGASYVGVGPAASSYDGDLRWTNRPDLDAWLNGAPASEDRLPPDRRAAEVLGFGLRTVRGWTRDEFRAATGQDYERLRGDVLRELADEGLLTLDAASVRPTERGLLFADMVARRLL